MKTIILALVMATTGIVLGDQNTLLNTNAIDILTSRGFDYVTASEAQQKNLVAAASKLKLVKQAKAQTRRIDQAVTYLSRSINYAVIMTPRACTEYNGYFWFSRLDTAGEDDKTFKSGFAVKKGTGEIYRWEEK